MIWEMTKTTKLSRLTQMPSGLSKGPIEDGQTSEECVSAWLVAMQTSPPKAVIRGCFHHTYMSPISSARVLPQRDWLDSSRVGDTDDIRCLVEECLRRQTAARVLLFAGISSYVFRRKTNLF
jgi:hypothetical protein